MDFFSSRLWEQSCIEMSHLFFGNGLDKKTRWDCGDREKTFVCDFSQPCGNQESVQPLSSACLMHTKQCVTHGNIWFINDIQHAAVVRLSLFDVEASNTSLYHTPETINPHSTFVI